MTVRRLLDAINGIAPWETAESWDRVGLMAGDPDAPLDRAAVALDSSVEAIEFAVSQSCQALVAHHPFIWDPLKRLTPDCPQYRALCLAVQSGIAVVAAHTNWDYAKGGVNDALAEALNLVGADSFGSQASAVQLKVVVCVPVEFREALIDALAEAGAGNIGAYRRCAFTSSGAGTFVAGEGASPFIGSIGVQEQASEDRVEVTLPASARRSVAAAIRRVHPYEEPAFDFYSLAPVPQGRLGRMGCLPQPMTLARLTEHAHIRLGSPCLAWGKPDLKVEKLAVVGGAAASEWRQAKAAGADALLTGEVKQDQALEAVQAGFAIIAAGHYATEQPGMAALANSLEALGIPSALFVPPPGIGGRPL